MLVSVGALRHLVGLGIPEPVSPTAFDAVLVPEAAVEPNRAVEGGLLGEKQVAELRLEGVGVGFTGEVAPEVLTGAANSVGYAVDQLAYAFFADLGVAADAGLAKIFGHSDIGGELRPPGGHLGAFELEHHRAVRASDDAVAELVLHGLERVLAGTGQLVAESQTPCFLRGLRLLQLVFEGEGRLRLALALAHRFTVRLLVLKCHRSTSLCSPVFRNPTNLLVLSDWFLF